MAVSNRLRTLRKAKGQSLHQLAAALPYEIAPSTLQRWELGTGEISDDFKFILAEHFETSVAHLTGWDRSKTKLELLI